MIVFWRNHNVTSNLSKLECLLRSPRSFTAWTIVLAVINMNSSISSIYVEDYDHNDAEAAIQEVLVNYEEEYSLKESLSKETQAFVNYISQDTVGNNKAHPMVRRMIIGTLKFHEKNSFTIRTNVNRRIVVMNLFEDGCRCPLDQ